MRGDVTVVSDFCLWGRFACKLRENATRSIGYRTRQDSSWAIMVDLAVSTVDALVALRKGGADATQRVLSYAKIEVPCVFQWDLLVTAAGWLPH